MAAELRMIRHGVVDSTNERAFAALNEGSARHLDLHVATGQTAGRGSRGRSWESEEGLGLYASLILLPAPPPPPAPLLTMASGLALLDAARRLGLVGAGLEWPNDLVVGGAKLGGILVEARGFENGRPRIVMGMGLNVAQRRFSAALAAERAVTSLVLEGADATPEAALEALVAVLPGRIAELAGDPRAITSGYLDATGLLARPVEVRTGQGAAHTGRILELGVPRGLLLEGPDGKHRRLALEHVTAITASL